MLPKIQNKKIAFAVLNWGMGHLTRSISILKHLEKENSVYFFGNREQIAFLKSEGFVLDFKEFPDYNLNFSGKSFLVEMIFNSPRMIQAIQIENSSIQKIHQQENFDLIISDNRFGFRSEKVPSIIVTHQLNIKSPLFEKQGSRLNQIYLNKFNEIWVPDTEDHHFSGDLSRAEMKTPIRFLGNISDLNFESSKKTIDYFVIGSGPEPYRTEFLKKMYNQLKSRNYKVVMTGFPDFSSQVDHILIYPSMSRKQIQQNILSSEIVISKAGYTTLLDLEKCKAKAILIPTKSQYEQEYLAQYHKNHRAFRFLDEKEIPTIW
ncbi:MAG: glycosyltransferase [Crocinitomicaceae bacterium]